MKADTRAEEVEVKLGTLSTMLEADLRLDLVELELNELVVRVTSTVKVREDLECL